MIADAIIIAATALVSRDLSPLIPINVRLSSRISSGLPLEDSFKASPAVVSLQLWSPSLVSHHRNL